MRFHPAWMLAGAVTLGGLGAWLFSGPPEPTAPVARPELAGAPPGTPPARAVQTRTAPPPRAETCRPEPAFAQAAAANAASLKSLAWAPFGRAETGWETYWPFVAREIATECDPQGSGFAKALADWQTKNQQPADGVFNAGAFDVMRIHSHRRRSFVAAFAQGCPPGAAAAELEAADASEIYGGKPAFLRRDALAAYRRMVAEAKRDPAIAADARNLVIVSGYRSPEEAVARCAGQDCKGPARVLCSAHQTGTAIDLYVGALPGLSPASTDDANRLFQSRTAAYRWLIRNAARFGFAPYVFEPWHWEYTEGPL